MLNSKSFIIFLIIVVSIAACNNDQQKKQQKKSNLSFNKLSKQERNNYHRLADIFYAKNLQFTLSGGILVAKNGEIESNWRRFENIQTFHDEKLVVFAKSEELESYGIDYGLFAHDMDSLQFKLKSYVHTKVDLKIKLNSKIISENLSHHDNVTSSIFSPPPELI